MSGADGQLSLWGAFVRSGITLEQLWFNYITVGGTLAPSAVAEALRRPELLDPDEHNLIAQAINEEFLDQSQDHPAAYRQVGDRRAGQLDDS